MAEVAQSGQVLEKTTRTRVITEPQSPQAPEFWQYIEQQNLPDADHILYLYLNRDNRNIPYGVYTSHFATRDGRLISIADREAFEQAIQHKFGGGVWRLILKCGRQRKCEAKLYTGDGPTLPPPLEGGDTQPMSGMQPHSPFGHLPTNGSDGTAAIASKAIDTIAGQEHQAVNLGLGMMTTAADVMKRFAERETNPTPAAGPVADLQAALLQATVARLTQDPMQQFMQMLAVFREANGNAGGGAPDMNRQMEQFRSVLAFARELAGGGNGSAAPSAGAAIVNTLAGIVPQAIDGIRATAEAWSQGKQAERDTVLLMQQPGRPGGPAAGPIPLTHSPFNPPPRPVLPATPAPAPAANGANVNVTQLLETKIMELFNAPIPPEEAASRALEFLHTMSGPNPSVSYVTLFASGGEDALVNLFNRQPILNPATKDMKRLLEFIRAFLRFHAEDQAEAPKPN